MADGVRPDPSDDDAVWLEDEPDRPDVPGGLSVLPSRRDTSSPDERERLVAEALAHAEAREAVYRRPRDDGNRWWKGALALLLLVLAGGFAAAPPAWLEARAPVTLPAGARVRGARLTLYLQARRVDAFRLLEGRLPVDLDEAGGALPGVRYLRSSDRVYQLVAPGPDGRAIVYDSTLPAPSFARAAARVPGLGGRS